MRKTLSLLLALALSVAAFGQEIDKPAMEKFFMEAMAVYEGPLSRPIPDSLQRIDKNLYVCDLGHYETEVVRAVSYFRRGMRGYVPVRDRKLPVESVATLLSGYTGDSHYTVYLKQHRYNYAMEEVEVPLDRLLGFCINGCGFVPYVGIEKMEKGQIKATLFLVNQELGFSHTLIFTIDQDLLGRDKGQMQAEAYTFTPIHNLAR